MIYKDAYLESIAVMPVNGQLMFRAVAAMDKDRLNMEVDLESYFDNGIFQAGEFMEILQDTIAKEFDIGPSKVVLQDQVIVGKIMAWSDRLQKMGLI